MRYARARVAVDREKAWRAAERVVHLLKSRIEQPGRIAAAQPDHALSVCLVGATARAVGARRRLCRRVASLRAAPEAQRRAAFGVPRWAGACVGSLGE